MPVWIANFKVIRPWSKKNHSNGAREQFFDGMEHSDAKKLYETTSVENDERYKVDPTLYNSARAVCVPHPLLENKDSIPLVNPNDVFEPDKCEFYERFNFDFSQVDWDLTQMIVFINFMLCFVRENTIVISYAVIVHYESKTVCIIQNNTVIRWESNTEESSFSAVLARMLHDSTCRDVRRKEYIDLLEEKMSALKRWELVDFIKNIFLENEGLLSEVFMRSFTSPMVKSLVEEVVNPMLTHKRARTE